MLRCQPPHRRGLGVTLIARCSLSDRSSPRLGRESRRGASGQRSPAGLSPPFHQRPLFAGPHAPGPALVPVRQPERRSTASALPSSTRTDRTAHDGRHANSMRQVPTPGISQGEIYFARNPGLDPGPTRNCQTPQPKRVDSGSSPETRRKQELSPRPPGRGRGPRPQGRGKVRGCSALKRALLDLQRIGNPRQCRLLTIRNRMVGDHRNAGHMHHRLLLSLIVFDRMN